jgi:hypothetical protein
VTVAGECLRILTLLQTLSKDSESQKGLMNLLLEAIVLVFSTSNDAHSREVDELRSTSIRLVSQLAQIPSSAIIFKDALLAMPVTRRQLLQDIIRASVTQEHTPVQTKSSTTLPLVIKLPTQTTEKNSIPSIPTKQTEISINKEEEQDERNDDADDDEDDDDWDAFQSFPASATENIPSSEVKSNTRDLPNPDDTFSDFTSTNDELRDVNQEVLEAVKTTKETSEDESIHVEESETPVNTSPDDEKISFEQSQENVESVEIGNENEAFVEVDPPEYHIDEKPETGQSEENVHSLSDLTDKKPINDDQEREVTVTEGDTVTESVGDNVDNTNIKKSKYKLMLKISIHEYQNSRTLKFADRIFCACVFLPSVLKFCYYL